VNLTGGRRRVPDLDKTQLNSRYKRLYNSEVQANAMNTKTRKKQLGKGIILLSDLQANWTHEHIPICAKNRCDYSKECAKRAFSSRITRARGLGKMHSGSSEGDRGNRYSDD
jgi:hypothetical protein